MIRTKDLKTFLSSDSARSVLKGRQARKGAIQYGDENIPQIAEHFSGAMKYGSTHEGSLAGYGSDVKLPDGRQFRLKSQTKSGQASLTTGQGYSYREVTPGKKTSLNDAKELRKENVLLGQEAFADTKTFLMNEQGYDDELAELTAAKFIQRQRMGLEAVKQNVAHKNLAAGEILSLIHI